ncbi:6,7-dimethyl-8-ribityllumazine synthase [Phytophthora nicotianae INRA-310]|uniref:6,7-dimethyl-8-ribityllumazine synthase n=1 Tax=Phytophthora nicotianae (strain INRA-310) TaxID=761204 RepID=W2QRE3_PHYN3|nr:6,7-dimethyl-8-ribityllumazine synthase [Phytophthora nicotianae INRA-310]ETN15688.1 6,7-dimethyl-8-ribityllumazine synthase [Phytophthora nicotianae INRA-310]
MAPGVETTTSKMKISTKEEHPVGASHGHEEGKSEATHSPVLIEQPGTAESSKLDGSGLRVTIVAARWYEKVIQSLVDACSDELLAKGVAEEDLHVVEVAGAFELPFAAARLVHCKDASHRPDAVICIGCLVNDATHTCETMSHAVANGIMKLNVTFDTPVIYGVLCCDSESQAYTCAEKRSCGAGEDQKCNHGVAWAQSALEMAHLKRCLSAKKLGHFMSRGGGKHKSEKPAKQEYAKHDVCSTCGSSAKECTCKDCKCRVCCNHRGDCASCTSSAENCSCEDCKCSSCSCKREACRGCGCPPDKCSCQGCNCVVCAAKEQASKKMPSTETSASSEHPSKHATSASSGGVQHGQCIECGSPSGQCKCGLLH